PGLFGYPRAVRGHGMNFAASIRSIGSVAKKEFLHIVRDWRVLILILSLPPAFTLLFGHAFEITAMKGAPALIRNADESPESEKLVETLRVSEAFAWRDWPPSDSDTVDLLALKANAALEIPSGWGASLNNGDPVPLRLVINGTATSPVPRGGGGFE